MCLEEVKTRDTGYSEHKLRESSGGGQLNIVNALLAANVNVNASFCGGYTALIKSAMAGHSDCVKLLLEAASDVERECSFPEETALIVSAKSGHVDCVKLLLEAASDVQQQCGYFKEFALFF